MSYFRVVFKNFADACSWLLVGPVNGWLPLSLQESPLFIFWIVLGTLRNGYFRFTLVAVGIHGDATTQYERYYQKHLAVEQKAGRGYPVVGEILVLLINKGGLHTKSIVAAKIGVVG